MELAQMAYTEPGVTGVQPAKRATFRDINPRRLVREIVETDPDGTEKSWRDAFWRVIKKELKGVALKDTYTEACIKIALDGAMRAELNQPTPEELAERHDAAARARKEAEQILLLALPMPNGKMFGQCTGAECSQFGGFYAKVAELISAKQIVGDVFTEKKLRQLWKEVCK